MIWNEEIETISRQDLEELQLKKLQKTVKRAFDKIPYYNKKYSNAEVFPEDIECLKDIEKLPFITKDDLNCIHHQEPLENLLYLVIQKKTWIHGQKQ